MFNMKGLLVVALVGLMVPLLVGCDDHLKREIATLRVANAESQNNLSEARARIAQLEEQISFLRSQGDASAPILAERQALIASLQAELATLRGFHDKLSNDHRLLIEKMAMTGTAGGPTGLPEAVKNLLKELQANYREFFTYDERAGRLQFASDVTFALGSADVSPKAQEALGKLAEILKQDAAAQVMVSVFGHTCDTPMVRQETIRRFRNNQGLSEARAQAVANVLGGRGIAASRITTAGFGDKEPISPTDKARNRRVEIYLTMAPR
jgi:flagellar motor protein MotB